MDSTEEEPEYTSKPDRLALISEISLMDLNTEKEYSKAAQSSPNNKYKKINKLNNFKHLK